VQEALPRGFHATQFVVRIVDGEIAELRAGRPIEILYDMLGITPDEPTTITDPSIAR
jgi:hypothetical protein